MKKYRFLLIGIGCLVLSVTFFFLYVIPYGKKVKQFEANFNQCKADIENTCQTLTTTNTLTQFTKSLSAFLLLPEKLREQKNNLNILQNDLNFLKGLWSKTTINPNDIDLLQKAVLQTHDEIPQLVSILISSDCKSRQNNIRNSFSLMDLNTLLNTTKVQYDSLFILLANTAKSKEFDKSISFNIIQKDKVFIEAMSNQSIEALTKLHDEQYKSVKESLLNSYTLKDASQLTNSYLNWIKTCKNAINLSLSLGSTEKKCQALNSNLDKDLEIMKELCMMFDNVIESEKNANNILLQALEKMDQSNNRLQNLEKFASSDDIMVVYNCWKDAEEEVLKAKSALNFHGSRGGDRQAIWDNLVSKPRSNIESIHESVLAHKNYVGEQYVQAASEESTVQGNVTRTVQRGWNRLKQYLGRQVEQASNTRIAKELSISVKLLILGTKAFYDLQNPNVDPLTWAFSYEGDVNNIMNETDQVMRMEGPSLTGKNTIVEDFVNIAYEKSFNK